MPLNRPALAVGPGPRSAQQARRWVVDTIRDIDRAELVDTAEMATSELVTNAILHGAEPITVRVRGTRLHPRVEVRDGSLDPPVMPTPAQVDTDQFDLAEDDLLVTFGRGLDIVARSSDAWGADIEESGKVMWFAPAAEFRDVGTPGTVTGLLDPAPHPSRRGAHGYQLLGTPLTLLEGFQRHYQELRREVRLLALAHEADYPLAKTLSDLFDTMQRELRDGLELGRTRGLRPDSDGTVDLTLHLSPTSAESMGRFVELLDFADEFCSRERMLSLARTPEQRTFQTWFLTELVRQHAGRAPQGWTSREAWRAQA